MGGVGGFHIVLLYDSAMALAATRHIVDTLVGKHVGEADVHRDELSFVEVMHPELRAESIQLTAGCDMFVVATADGTHLPGEVASWIDLWLEMRPEKETALVSIAGTRLGCVQSTAVQNYLHHLAEEHRLSFFSSNFTLPEAELKPAEEVVKSESARRIPHDIAPRPERWGLNE